MSVSEGHGPPTNPRETKRCLDVLVSTGGGYTTILLPH